MMTLFFGPYLHFVDDWSRNLHFELIVHRPVGEAAAGRWIFGTTRRERFEGEHPFFFRAIPDVPGGAGVTERPNAAR